MLDNAGRRKLVRRELQEVQDKIINSQLLLSLSREITQIFPKEHISTYFIPYINYGKFILHFNKYLVRTINNFLNLGPTIKKAAKGKLLDYFNNRKREYKKAGIITSVSKQSSPSIIRNIESSLQFSHQENGKSKFIYLFIY